ncbi:MAG TPA: iron-containing alcohol dehydrogenase [Candidatus Paceibacterota bacterium]|nr:iron-containing alcohol dehydrogenase [Verrucomicrobiota bacterium]HSA09850.1 iron-containing alcohol dehydrogenase [Candidatus Paceibacterota bacterium]
MRFEFATATRIICGAGALHDVGPLARDFGPNVLVVTGSDPRRAAPVLALLREHGLASSVFSVRGEPKPETVRQGVALARELHCTLIIAFGGGSVVDAGKAIAAMLANSGELLDYLEVIGHGKALTQPSVPFIAIPTTAGTGSEVTRNAVLASPQHRVKVSLRSPFMLPKVAVVDPELTYDLPPALTASTGLDALTQLIEPYVSSRANPMTDALCVEGIRRAARSLRTAFADGRHAAARMDMCVASLFGGLALANAGLGAVHGFAGPIGGQFPAPHGAVCAALLPHVMEGNLRALRQRLPGAGGLRRYDEVARLLTGSATATAEAGVEWVRRLVADLRIPSLGHYGLTAEHTAELVPKAFQASSMKANPIALTPEELGAILQRAL